MKMSQPLQQQEALEHSYRFKGTILCFWCLRLMIQAFRELYEYISDRIHRGDFASLWKMKEKKQVNKKKYA